MTKSVDSLLIIRRSGQEMKYERNKITKAIRKANNEFKLKADRLNNVQINAIVDDIERYLLNLSYNAPVEDIQDMVIYGIMKQGAYKVAKAYTEYRYKHNMKREMSGFDKRVLSIVDYENEDIKQENSNKNPQVASVQRDYVSGEVSKEITRNLLLPDDIVRAHDEGIIHFHDMDYFLEHIYNCCLINLEDMLQHGTVISETMIEPPKSFSTACNISTQVIAQVASSQYGGQSFSLAALVPFIDVSRQKLRKTKKENMEKLGLDISDEMINKLVEMELKQIIKDGVQMIQYQILTLMTTNGQTPFVSMFIWINEVEDKYKDDFAILIEEVLNQRIKGIKNEKGVYLTPAFPKILYVLDDNNVYEDSEYFWLTKLAAKCTAKRMVPDYISAKIMREYKGGDVYPCMGCVDGRSEIQVTFDDVHAVGTFENIWKHLEIRYPVKSNQEGHYIDTRGENVSIYDGAVKGYVDVYGFIRKRQKDWVKVVFDCGRYIDATIDHPFELTNGKVTLAGDLSVGDEMFVTGIMGDLHTTKVIGLYPYQEDKYSYDVTTASEHFTVNGIYSHNCRSFLTPDRFSEIFGNISKAGNFKEGKHKYYGRFNQGVCTINLVDVACSSGKDMDKFWEILDERLELCHRALRCRHERLLGTPADIAPILFRYGAIARLDKGEKIDKLLYNGYSTISLGYAGLFEMCNYMTGVSHTDPKVGKPFAMKVMQRLNDKCNEWKAAENIDYSVYGTPIESTTYKFAKCLKKRFGVIPGVTDKNYITNSYHCNVREKISAFDKLTFESQFQELSQGGAISYVEVPDMTGNLDAVIAIIQHIYENIMYAEINSKSDYCMECGYDGEIKIVEDTSGKLVWECPCCGNRDQNKMSVARRTCGYIGTQFWNQGRTQEIKERVLHVDFHDNEDI